MPRLSKIGAAALAAFGWTSGSSISATYLQVAGGGAGGGTTNAGNNAGGGGGAGGYLTGTTTLNPTLSYTVVVGAGGVGTTFIGGNGNNSQFGTLTASVGGGGGGSSFSYPTYINGANGGSGGGAASGVTTGTGGSATSGQGNIGGDATVASPAYGGGGGGGAGSAGGTNTSSSAGNGGNGLSSSISGGSTFYAGGGGGAVYSGTSSGTGGTGGGGAGAPNNGTGTAGTANTGGGGGGSCLNGTANRVGANGGSGIVIISYLGAQQFGGGVVTSSGGYTIHTFNTSGTLAPLSSLTASYLIVAGGGSGGTDSGGGGGAGGLLSGSGVTIDTNSTYLVTVGAGGTAPTTIDTVGSAGGNSKFSMVTTSAVGGGYGGAYNAQAGGSGGSGGGGGANNTDPSATVVGGSGTASQGNAGGNGGRQTRYVGGGGGGAGAVGGTVSSGGIAGNGGNGLTSSISGTSTYYAGGGGGGGSGLATPGTGGNGGGGAGSATSGVQATSGTANTGGGGGGGEGAGASTTAGNGGSGVVIISYAGSTQLMAGGTVTITGGNVIHTFTSSGYLTPLKLVNNSLRFRSSANGYLNRTPATASNQKTWTTSFWCKRTPGANQDIFAPFFGGDGSNESQMYFRSDDTFQIYDSGATAGYMNYITTQVFRDPAAWYHIVVACDTTQATSTNRLKIYVNGVQITVFSTATVQTQNLNTGWNGTSVHQIGKYPRSTFQYYDGYLAEFNFIDGQQLTPNSFGTFNSYGVWQPITYGGSYGTNGFYLPFKTQSSSTYVGAFSGSNNLSVASNTAFDQPADFTIEYWANITTNTNYQVAVGRGTGCITIQHSSDANGMVRLVRYGSALIASGGNVIAGAWNHFAIVRSGSTVTGYLNGVAVCSGTDSTATATGSALSIGQLGGGTGYFTGSISNVRIVKGTAVYTSNFTPSTTPLTAITNTQLLTCQNATFVDNSTNAFSITNTGTVTSGQTYPFAINIFNDQSSAGNNWTPNNISGASGSTLDYMTDVPTLTSATVANYCVLNPLSNDSTNTLSNANLTYSIAANGSGYPTSTIQFNSDKYYWECTVTSTYNIIGIVLGTTGTTTQLFTTGYGYYATTGNKYVNGTSSAYGSTFTTGDVIGVAVDMTALTITFYKNNTSQGAISIAAGLYKIAGGNGNSSAVASGSYNFGQQPFVYTPPSGYLALNTYNL